MRPGADFSLPALPRQPGAGFASPRDVDNSVDDIPRTGVPHLIGINRLLVSGTPDLARLLSLCSCFT